MQADAASVYDALFEDGPKEVGCWSHARRNFHECIGVDSGCALIAIGYIDKLSRLSDGFGTRRPPNGWQSAKSTRASCSIICTTGR